MSYGILVRDTECQINAVREAYEKRIIKNNVIHLEMWTQVVDF
jgi:hypothetical protein